MRAAAGKGKASGKAKEGAADTDSCKPKIGKHRLAAIAGEAVLREVVGALLEVEAAEVLMPSKSKRSLNAPVGLVH